MNPPDNPLLCFENAKDAQLYAGWHPEEIENLFTFQALSETLSESKSLEEAERLTLAEAIYPDETPEYRKSLLRTIEFLRTGWLMTAQDVDYAFSQLPPTPKNQKLRIQFQTYLQSPLRADVAQSLYETREKLQSPEGNAWERQVRFLKSDNSSPQFEEIGKSFPSPAVPEEIGAPSMGKKAAAIHGDPAEALYRLVQASKRFTGTSIIAFGGTRSELVLLKCLLSAEGIEFQDDLSETIKKDLDDPLSVVRRTTIPSQEKRPLEKKIFARRSEQRAKRLSADNYLKMVVPEVSTQHSHRGVIAPEMNENASVQIVPLRRLVAPKGSQVLGFAGGKFLEVKLPEMLLTAEEIETLRGKDLPLKSPLDLVLRREAILQWYATGFRENRFLFTSLSKDAFESTRFFPVRATRPKARAAEAVKLSLPVKPFSATGLENLAQCPMKFMFAQKLRLRAAPEENQDQAPVYYGQLVHKALETVFQEPGLTERDSPEVLTAHFERAIDTLFPHLKPKNAFSTLLRTQFKRTAHQIAPLEKALSLIRGPGSPINFEKQFTVEWNGFELKGVIDRIDETTSGDLLVIDYKTGTVDFSPTHIPSGANFQALIYWIAVEKMFNRRCMGVLFYDLKKCEIRRGLMRSESISAEAKKMLTRGHALDPEKFQLITDSGVAEMERLMKLSAEGEFAPRPSAENCSFCEFQILCRRAHGYV